jgi:hypothetical protein
MLRRGIHWTCTCYQARASLSYATEMCDRAYGALDCGISITKSSPWELVQLKFLFAIIVIAILLGVPSQAAAQLNSNEATVTLSAELLESLTVSVLPGLVTFSLTSRSATNPGNTSVAVTTSWTLALTRDTVKLYAYFSSSSVALAHSGLSNTVDIPSSRVEVSVNGGANMPFNQTVAFAAANAGRELFSEALTVLNIASNRTDTIALNINLSSFVLPADMYTGTLRLRAQATP